MSRGATQTGKGGGCPQCRRHGAGCVADANRQHKFRDPYCVKEKPMKQRSKRRRKNEVPVVRRWVEDAPHLSVKLVSRCPKGGSQCIVKVEDSEYMETYTLTRHHKLGVIILSSTLSQRPKLDSEGNVEVDDLGRPVFETYRDELAWEVKE